MTRYWELKHEDGTDDAELYIFGDIAPDDWKWSENDRSAMDIVKAIEGLSAKNLIVHINSYGGDVKEGLAIYNCIKNCGMNVTTINDGFACSAASVIFMAGKQRVMNDASLLMIHNPYMMAVGNPDELRKAADDLEMIAQASVEAYKNNSNLSEDKIKELMKAETWILPTEAVDYGMATLIKEKTEDGIKQSAMKKIMQSLCGIPKMEEDEIMAKLESMDKKLDDIISAVDDKNDPHDPDDPDDPKDPDDPDNPKEPEEKTGFNLFF